MVSIFSNAGSSQNSTELQDETENRSDPAPISSHKPRFIGPWVPVIILLAMFLALGILRLDREISFYDEGVYVINAKSLAMGAGYRNLSLPGAPPQGKYPPFFPFLLSIVWRMLPDFPDNLVALKALVLLMAVAFLVVAYSYLRKFRRLDSLDSLAVVAIIGLNPFFLLFATLATSDIPYALLSLLALYLYEQSSSNDGGVIFGLMLVVGVLAFLTRTAGMFLLAAIIADLTRQRRFRRAITAATMSGVVVGLWLLWSQWASSAYAQFADGVRENYVGYSAMISVADLISQLPQIIIVNLRLLLHGWQLFLFPWLPLIAGVLLPPVVYLFLRHFRPRLRVEELYCALYLLTILLIPYPDTPRYFLAISPFLIAYFITGLRSFVCKEVCRSWPEWRARRMAYLFVGGLTLVTLVVDVSPSWGHDQQRTDGMVEFHRMLDWINQNVPPEGILVGDYDPAYYLFTGRKSIRLSVNVMVWYTNEVSRGSARTRDLLESFRSMKACYIIRDPLIGGPEGIYYRNLVERLKEVSPEPLDHLYKGPTAEYAVYKHRGCP